ncbi:MAG: peptide deformylase [Candidatus Levybacteria bacterium]|nr:peptide deformylase [Candidatus Levybacteria bacterium]
MLNIITAPNPVLSQSAKQIPEVNLNILKLIEEMEETLLTAKDPQGVGLAAPQIDKSLQIFLAKPTPKSSTLVFINPKIVSSINAPIQNTKYKIQNTKLEGCLSLPNIWGEVNRLPQITLSYMDTRGASHKRTFKGFIATIIQHETDHLNGILFPKRVLEQKGKLYKSRKNKKGEDVFEEIEL